MIEYLEICQKYRIPRSFFVQNISMITNVQVHTFRLKIAYFYVNTNIESKNKMVCVH